MSFIHVVPITTSHVDVGPCGRESSFHSPTFWPQWNMQIGESPNLSFGTECYSSELYDSANADAYSKNKHYMYCSHHRFYQWRPEIQEGLPVPLPGQDH